MEWSQHYQKVKAAGGVIHNHPPEITQVDDCIINCIMDLAGERNAEGYIPISKVYLWGGLYDIPKSVISYYWDVIKVSESKVKKWHSAHST